MGRDGSVYTMNVSASQRLGRSAVACARTDGERGVGRACALCVGAMAVAHSAGAPRWALARVVRVKRACCAVLVAQIPEAALDGDKHDNRAVSRDGDIGADTGRSADDAFVQGRLQRAWSPGGARWSGSGWRAVRIDSMPLNRDSPKGGMKGGGMVGTAATT